ncbi:MAG: hypothetical protein FJ026_18395 [Chloroflexi bacterium]|nr:hypothetical protein [Chloroflexota bacterium]
MVACSTLPALQPKSSPTSLPAGPAPILCTARHSDPCLGFALEYPTDWQLLDVSDPGSQVFPPERVLGAIQLVSNLHAGGEQALGRYVVTLTVGESSWSRTVTDTVEYYLTTVLPTVGPQVQRRDGLWLGGEPAIELSGFSWERWGRRVLVAMYQGREYWLGFSPAAEFNTPSDAVAAEAFDDLVRSFQFISVTVAPTPTLTPVPTPQSGARNAGNPPSQCHSLG